MSCLGWYAGETTWPFVMIQPLGLTNQPVPVSRRGGGVTCCVPPPGQGTVISAGTSDPTSATAGFARSKTSWTDAAAVAATPGTARSSALAIHLRILRILYCAKYKKKAPGGDPWSLFAAHCKNSETYFISPIASTAFVFAASMFPALQAASASRTSFATSPLEALAPASDRGAWMS